VPWLQQLLASHWRGPSVIPGQYVLISFHIIALTFYSQSFIECVMNLKSSGKAAKLDTLISGIPRNFFRGVHQIQLRTDGRENGDLGALAP
jgi:hypothetical protein